MTLLNIFADVVTIKIGVICPSVDNKPLFVFVVLHTNCAF